MRRFWIDEIIGEDQVEWVLEGDVLHHVRDVCRMAPGARFEILTENRKAWFVELKEVGKRRGVVRVLEQRALPEIPGPRLHLMLSIPKFVTFENVVEKSVELGVYSIQPFFSDFSFVRTNEKISLSRLQRWKKIVKSATQQSGRGELMPVETPLPLREVLKKTNDNKNDWKGLFAYEGDSHQSLREELKAWELSKKSVTDVALFIGSEGGFSNGEVELFQQQGLAPVTLGEQILRVETACVALVSIIKHSLGGFG